KTPAPALTAQVNCAYACAAASHANAWLAEHFKSKCSRSENERAASKCLCLSRLACQGLSRGDNPRA
ncbi:hypothetical protein, partial [Desulfocurvibacter africanus]|uniref:hypothetical protein n=1 Tax=Desulfocurvibacter africanus TaxID=873 RepID=UPI001EE655CF